ncbi:MAG: hypothetical protein AAFZ92_08920 [Pseudomonadota bacterium]
MTVLKWPLPFSNSFNQQHKLSLNYSFLLTALALLSIGLVTVASASIDFAAVNYSDPLFFMRRHLLYLLIALLASVFMLQHR